MGLFSGFLHDPVELVGVEAGGKGLDSGRHASRLCSPDASIGVAQGYKTYFLQNDDGQMLETHSMAAGLDYVGVSPILSHFTENGRVRFEAATDKEVVEALALTMRKEGLIPALESGHAFARPSRRRRTFHRTTSSSSTSPDEATRISLPSRMPSKTRPGEHSSNVRRSTTMIESYIRKQREKKDILLMTHIVIGYPSLEASFRIVREMVEAGVDLMELQIPFSEPMADGPVILKANQDALAGGITVQECIDFAARVTAAFDIPFLFMSYYNILFKYGVDSFARTMAQIGARGDCPRSAAGRG